MSAVILFYCLFTIAINIWIKHSLILLPFYSSLSRDDWIHIKWKNREKAFIIWSQAPLYVWRWLPTSLSNSQTGKVVFWIKFIYFTCVISWTAHNLILLQGANFRDLPGICVGADNVVRLHPTEKIPLLPSGKPLVSLCIAFIGK